MAALPMPARRCVSRVLCRAMAALCCLVLADIAQAQSSAPVVQVVMEQEGRRVTDPLVVSLVETRAGMAVDMRQVRETIAHLMSLGRFDDVQVVEETAAEGVRLRYVLKPNHPIDRVEFRGALGVSESDVRRAVVDRFGAVPPAGRIADAQRAVEAFYRARGFIAARVTPLVEESHNPDRASLVFDIQAGTRAKVEAVDVDGVAPADAPMLMADVGVRVGMAYDAEAVANAMTRHEAGLRARGYYEARATHGVRFQPDGSARVTLIVSRGPLVSIAFEGDALPDGERDRLVPVRSEASVDEDLLEDSTLAIEEYLRARGYRDAEATYRRSGQDERLEVTFVVNRGRRYAVESVMVEGNRAISSADIAAVMSLRPQAPFVQETVDAALSAVRALYRSRGFSRSDVRAMTTAGAVVDASDQRSVSVVVSIVEGPRTRVGQVTFERTTALSDAQLLALVTSAPGRPFAQADIASDRDRLDLEYRNRGYDGVVVTPSVVLRDEETVADVTFVVSEGQQALVDHIIVIGNRRTRTSTIENEITFRSGQPLGAAELLDSQQRLAALGLFRRIQMTTIVHPGEARRDIVVRVDEAPPTTVGYGGGVESGLRLRPTGEGGQAEERFEVAPRGFFEIGRRNLWGKNRAVNLFGRVSLRSRDVVAPGGPPTLVPGEGGYGFNEYRFYATYREPRFAGTPADLLITGIINQAVRSSFNFITREMRAEAGARLSPRISLAARYQFEQTRLFDEQITAAEKPLIDRLFPQVRLSGFSASMIRDTRDDGLYPNSGTFTVLDGELAARGLGSEVGYVKTFAQMAAYVPLPARRRMILALAARLGAARGFPRVVPAVDGGGVPQVGVDGQPVWQVVQDLPASKRFFAGGDTTVRGFSLDRLGDEATISPTGFPTGGNGEVILNGELRVGVLRERAEVVGFLDAGNVFQRASDLDITDLRAAAGFGFRYRSPVGPIRIDAGFNLKRRELLPGQLERGYVLHISLGQAF